MNTITFPLNRQASGPDVADLQDALQRLIDRRALLAADPDTARELSRLLTRERSKQTFGANTGKLVSHVQREQGLPASGDVDEATADRLNASLGGLDPVAPRPRTHVVSGAVRREDGLPLQGIHVRAAHETEQQSVRLGEDTTDAKGRYTIRYEVLPGVEGVRLRVSATRGDGTPLPSSDVVDDAKPHEVVDLVAPMADTPGGEQRIEGTVVLEHG